MIGAAVNDISIGAELMGSILSVSDRTQSRHCSHISSKLCYMLAKTQRWAATPYALFCNTAGQGRIQKVLVGEGM